MEPPRKRRRPALSCYECRRRKIKCDRNLPCGQCSRLGIPNCSFAKDVQKPADRKANPESVVDLAQPEDYNKNQSPPISSKTSRTLPPSWPTLISPPSSLRTDEVSDGRGRHCDYSDPGDVADDRKVEALQRKIRHLENTISDLTNKSPDASESGPTAKPVRGIFNKTRLFGQSNWMNSFDQSNFNVVFVFESACVKLLMLRQFDKMRSLADENLLSTDGFGDFSIAGEINTILAKCKGLARATKASRPSPLASIPDLHDTIPSRSLADILVRHFFRIQLNKVVHLPSFRKEYEQYWANPKASTLGFLIKLLLIMSIGAAFHEPAEYERELHECVAKWVHAASCWVSTPYDKDRLNLTGLQVHCLLHISRQVNSIGGDVVWISAGSMLRIAILMGLHRDPSHFPKMSAMQGEIRRRLWATVLEFQLQSCLDTGMPPMLPLDDFDTALPANLNDEDLSEAMKMAPESRPLEELTNTSASVILARTTRTRYEISRLINDFQREPNYDEVLRLSRELSAHLREATLLMQGYRSSSNAAPRDDMFSYEFTSFQQQLVLTLIRRFLLALHRPFAHKARMNPRYYYSRKVCTESALEIITPSEVDTSDDKGWSRLLAVGGGLYREVPSHAAITLCLELIIRLEEDAANMTLQRNKAQREPIRQAVNEMIALGKERIINGETNVKGLVFFAMVMTQIDEMEKGDTDHPERAMFEAAKKLAETCYDLLKTSRKSSPKAPLLPPSSSTSTSTSTSSDAVTITKHPSTSTTMNNTSTENNKWNPPSNTTSHMQQNSSISNTEFNDPMLGYDTASMDEELLGGLDLLGQSSWFYNVGWNDSSWV